jgi:hypothetical protein
MSQRTTTVTVDNPEALAVVLEYLELLIMNRRNFRVQHHNGCDIEVVTE